MIKAWWDALWTRKETPLNEVADAETVEYILSRLDKITREMVNLQYEWTETLDKLTSVANRASARQRKRTQRELAALEEGEDDASPELLVPVHPPAPPVSPPRPLTKLERIQQQIAEQRRRAGGA